VGVRWEKQGGGRSEGYKVVWACTETVPLAPPVTPWGREPKALHSCRCHCEGVGEAGWDQGGDESGGQRVRWTKGGVGLK
jgi:hypothetical protein